MTTESQIRANKKNAQKSTGPKTAEGKAKSAQNATKHGLTATTDVIQGESQEEFDAHKQGFLDVLDPQNAIEDFLADHVVSLAWRLKRADRIERQLLDGFAADQQYLRDDPSRNWHYPSSSRDPDLTLGTAVRRDLDNNKTLNRLSLYERRIERSFFKSLSELKRRKRKTPLTPDSVMGVYPGLRSAAQAGIQTRHCEERSDEAIPSSTLTTNPAKQTQIADLDPTATASCKDTYNLCLRGSGVENKPNDPSPGAPKHAPRTTYRSGTRRY